MSQYTLGIEETNDGPRRARVFDTASEAVDVLDEWRTIGATVSIILRDDFAVDKPTLRADAERERTVDDD